MQNSLIIQKLENVIKSIPHNILLNIITKKIESHNIESIINTGHNTFGENYVQEAQKKWMPILEQHPKIVLSMVGHLQLNKVKDAARLFHKIETIDSIELAESLGNESTKIGRNLEYYVQINIGDEKQKYGVLPNMAMDLIKECPIKISGIMCIHPKNQNPIPFFIKMNQLARNIENTLGHKIAISMGMSNDYQDAIKHCATEVRIGTAIFGER